MSWPALPLEPMLRVLASVTSLLTCLPSCWMVTATRLPGFWCRIAVVNWFQVCTGWPAKATIVSPGCRPIWAAGEGASPEAQPDSSVLGTHFTTVPTVVVLVLARPTASGSISSRKKASTKCMNEPATSTITRCQPGFTRNDRGSSTASTSSIEVMPTIFTNPPAGMPLTPYSVSPRLRDHRVGPKPRKNWVAFMPNFLAVAKCPNSFSMTEMDKVTMKMTQPSSTLIRRLLPPLDPPARSGSGQFPCPHPCPAVSVQHVLQADRPPPGAVMFRDYPHHGVHYPGERDAARQKGRDTFLVGRVVHRGAGAARGAHLPGQRDSREGFLVQRAERPGVRRGPVDRGGRVGHPVRPGQRERDRYPHVRRAGLGECGPVGELHHRVDDRLRVHDDAEPAERHAEQQVRLDQLQALVDQGGAVHRDDRAHLPGGMGERLLRGHIGQLGPAAAAERPAAGGQHQAPYFLGPAAAQALRDRRVLGVDRDDLPRLGPLGHQRPADDQRLLVRQRERAAGVQAGQ